MNTDEVLKFYLRVAAVESFLGAYASLLLFMTSLNLSFLIFHFLYGCLTALAYKLSSGD